MFKLDCGLVIGYRVREDERGWEELGEEFWGLEVFEIRKFLFWN